MSVLVVFVVASCGSDQRGSLSVEPLPEPTRSAETSAAAGEPGASLDLAVNDGTAPTLVEQPSGPAKETSPASGVETNQLVFEVAGEMTLSVDVPLSLTAEVGGPVVTDRDRENGLFLLQRWADAESGVNPTLSVTTHPGADSVLIEALSDEPFAVEGELVWRVAENDFGTEPNPELRIVFAEWGNYLVNASGSEPTVRALISGISIDGRGV